MGVVLADRALAAADARPLQLEVYVNDTDARLIGTFTQLADRRIAATRGELTELGIAVPGAGAADEIVAVDDLKGVRYRYDEPAQKIFFQLGDAARVRRTYDARAATESVGAPRSDWGAVMNYALFGSSMKALDHTGFVFSGANASLDSRVFGPYGTFSQTGIVGTTLFKAADALRLDSTWTYSDIETMTSYRAGDTISGGLAWTRPIRIGGVQVQRNFGLRPDLVTLPLPAIAGSAAVPSTVDVYLNNLKTYSQDVAAGPYQITNLPMLTGAGTARIVVHDSAGREVQTSLPFYSTPKLLKEGLMDFSAEAGFARYAYGIESASYGRDPVGSATARRGVLDWLTVEAHAEGGAGLYNGGIGAIAQLGTFGTLSVAGTGSESLALGPLAAPSLAGGVVTGRSAVPRPDRPRTADQDVPAEPDGPDPSATARGRASSVARGVAVVPPADPPVDQQPTRSRPRPAARQSEPRFGPASDGAELGNVSPGLDPGCRRTRGNQGRFG